MGFRASLALTAFFVICDLALLSVRFSFSSGGTVGYILLALQEAVLLVLAVLLVSFVLRTYWLLVGSLRDAVRPLKVVGPLWVLRIVLTFLPTLYREVVLPPRRHEGSGNRRPARAWRDVGYGVLCSLHVALFLFFTLALLHVICYLSAKALYPRCGQGCRAQVSAAAAAAVLDPRRSARSSIQHNPFSRRSCDDGTFSLADATSQGMPWVTFTPRTPTLAVFDDTTRNGAN
ncbi:uncharacterized protein Tco025E_02610 [Trypanosoma conorhini]|uniref:Transmembrane protein 138 n=1 Tax=Trypanosoma conorhini TaxID=83891 RepID=A0A3R7PRI6_9TRYP|nr:uncharacterized protein Tco025E_02610 [Trypanosoma conorhini]RNF24110.1 hypothetical protein Tco025E_02610 [Trypanosoma conorhini]